MARTSSTHRILAVLVALAVLVLLVQSAARRRAPPLVPASTAAIRFHGTGTGQQDRVRIPIDDDQDVEPDASSPCDVGAGSFTIELWLRGSLGANGTANAGGDVQLASLDWIYGNIVVDRDIWGGSSRDFGVSVAGGFVRFGTGRGDAGSDDDDTIEGDTSVLDGAWHHVAVVRDASSGVKRIYVDGALDFESAPGTSLADLSYPDAGVSGQVTPWGPFLVVGAEKHDAGADYPSFDGTVDELRIWSVARTAAAIQRNRNRRVSPAAAGLVADYRFDEGAGTVVADASVAGSPDGELIAGVPGNGEWLLRSDDPSSTAPVLWRQ